MTIDPTVIVGPALACNITMEWGTSCGDGMTIGENCPDACQFYRGVARFDVSQALSAGAVVEFALIEPKQAEPTPHVGVYQMTAGRCATLSRCHGNSPSPSPAPSWSLPHPQLR